MRNPKSDAPTKKYTWVPDSEETYDNGLYLLSTDFQVSF